MCIWNRVLSQDEIRLLRHLTKDKIIETDNDLMVYLQFNEDSGTIYDKSNNTNNSTLNGSSERVISTAPVGGGLSEKLTVINPGTYSSISGVQLEFDEEGTLPNGDLIFTRINLRPDTITYLYPSSKSYWIINNYGSNQSFSSLTRMTFEDSGILTSFSSITDYRLLSRTENADGPLWNNEAFSSNKTLSQDLITFETGLSINTFGQYVLLNNFAKGWIGVDDTEWSNPLNWGGGIVPTISDEVIIPAYTPFSPFVTTPVQIKSLLIQNEAEVKVTTGSVGLN